MADPTNSTSIWDDLKTVYDFSVQSSAITGMNILPGNPDAYAVDVANEVSNGFTNPVVDQITSGGVAVGNAEDAASKLLPSSTTILEYGVIAVAILFLVLILTNKLEAL